MATNTVLNTNHQVLNIQNILVTYPPSNNGMDFPYSLEAIVSRCIKLAANPNVDDYNISINEMQTTLSSFDTYLTNELITQVKSFIQYLRCLFSRFGWYQMDGSAPHRFVGFLPGTFDIEVRSG